MPKIATKEETLNGAADIIKYVHRDCYYLRVKRESRKYSVVSLNTEDLDIARRNSIQSYMEVMKEPPKRKISKQSFIKACENYIEHKRRQVKRKEITIRSANTYEQRVHQRIIPFAKSIILILLEISMIELLLNILIITLMLRLKVSGNQRHLV